MSGEAPPPGSRPQFLFWQKPRQLCKPFLVYPFSSITRPLSLPLFVADEPKHDPATYWIRLSQSAGPANQQNWDLAFGNLDADALKKRQ